MISEAALYFVGPDDLRAGATSVAGWPVAFRVVMAAVRAGCRRVWVPAVLRAVIGNAVATSASAGAAVAWLDPAVAPTEAPLLLLPATALVPPAALQTLLAEAAPAVLAVSRARNSGAIATVPAAGARALWDRVAAGKALGDALDRALADGRATVVESGWYARVVEPRDAAGAEAALYAALGSPIDTPLDRAVHRRLSRPLSRLAVRFGLTPNQVTLASLAVGLAAAWCFWEAAVVRALAGLALYAAAVVLDHADGEVARLTLAESTFGQRLDVVVDTVVHVLLVLALGATAQHAAGGGWAAGIVAAVGVVASAVVTKTLPAAPSGGGTATTLAALGNRNGYYAMLVIFIVLLATLPAALSLLMAIIAAGCHAFWLGWLAYALTGRR